MAKNILIIDDKTSILEILGTTLSGDGYETSTASDGRAALDALENDSFDMILCDVHLPDIDGTEILKKAKAMASPPSVIMITAYGSIENAIECMKLGADDYVTKPFNLDEIKEIVKKGLEKVALLRENARLRAELEKKYEFSGIIAKSRSMEIIFEKIRKIAPSNASVLISGDTGVGKELVSRAIHYNSQRKKGKFVAINCAAIPENLLESELFGHVKGAFTGAVNSKRGLIEYAEGGTLLLDEIADLHVGLQAKLLRTLDDGSIRMVGDTKSIPIDVRLVCSTNKDLAEEIEKGTFRLDLYHRIKVVELHIPPLSERREDIMPITKLYLARLCEEHGKSIISFSPNAVNSLLSYPWPGNVRELINILEQVVLTCDGDVVTAAQLATILDQPAGEIPTGDLLMEDSLKKMMARVERNIIKRVLAESDGNRKATAGRLALSERALYYKLDEYELK